MRQHTVDLRGHSVVVTIHGEAGLPVVLLAGGGASPTWYFPELVDALAATNRVVLYDRLGTGTSPIPAGGMSLVDASADLRAVLDALGFDEVVIIGHSLGGALAAMFVVDYSERVAGALLLDPTPINDAALVTSTARNAARVARATRLPGVGAPLARALLFLGRPRRMSPTMRAAFDRTMAGDWIGDAARAARSLPDDSIAFGDRRPSRAVPTVLVTADRKATARPRVAHEALARQIGAGVELWPGTGHGLHLQRPDDVIAAARRLVSATAAASRVANGDES